MNVFIEQGINWIITIQSLAAWLELPMRFFSSLGNENFFLLVLPLIYWSLDAELGLRIALLLGTSNYVNSVVKLLCAAPRPHWVNAQVKPLLAEASFGSPSGHAQNAAAL